MMRKNIATILSCAMFASTLLSVDTFALNYSPIQNTEATFETLEETRETSVVSEQNLEPERVGMVKQYMSHPCLDNYPEGTTFVYRSANMYGGRAAARLNTNLIVFSDQHFDDKASAEEYLKGLGVTDIVDQAVGSVVLVTPIDAEAGFGVADQKAYYLLQTAMLAQKESQTDADGNVTYYSDAEYFGGYGYEYVIGIDGGATFLNDYVSTTFDYVSRIAGMCLIGGKMDHLSEVAAQVPVYIAGAEEADETAVEQYKKANDVDSFEENDTETAYFNQALPLQRVVLAKEFTDAKTTIADAYNNMFIKAMRVPVNKRGRYTAGTPYQGYGFDEAPYSLCDRNAVINGRTEDGINLIEHQEERFSEVKTKSGEYLQTWFEYLPDEVLNNTAPEHSVPLWLANHGGGDDPRLFVDEIGLLDLAGSERFAIVAPEHQYIGGTMNAERQWTDAITPEVLPQLVQYMLDTYPALDPSRVYVTGYSMGGRATLAAISGDASLFAAAVPMAAAGYDTTEEEAAQFADIDIPLMLTTSTYDLGGAFDSANMTIASGYQTVLNRVLGWNEMAAIDTYDFETYPIVGFKANSIKQITLNNEYKNTTWLINNKDGVPMAGVSYTEGLVHALYPEYAKVAWNFAKHYSRNPETREIVYDPYVE